MKNMTDETKKRLVIAGGLAISAVLVILIAKAFKTPTVEDVSIQDGSSGTPSIVVGTPDITEKKDGIVIPDIEIPEETENPNGNDKGTDQTIQPDIPEKPTYTEEQLTTPNQKPNGEKVEPPTKENPNPPQTQDKPTENSSKSTGGLPGFDNVPNAGENETIYVDGMKENGNKVGSMD